MPSPRRTVDEQQRAALLDRAAKMLDTAIGAYTAVAARFEQMQNYSVQSYALYNLGLAQKARADLYLDSYDDAAHGVPLYRQAADTFARCSALSDRPDKSVRPDKDGYTGLQKRMRCFCDLEQGAVKGHVARTRIGKNLQTRSSGHPRTVGAQGPAARASS